MRKITIEVSEETYVRLSATAAEAGLSGVEGYLASLIEHEVPNYDHLFTPERMQEIERASLQVREGRVSTYEEVEKRHMSQRQEWIEKNGQ